MVKRSDTYTKDISTLSKDEEKENRVSRGSLKRKNGSNVGATATEKRKTIVHRPSAGKNDPVMQKRKRGLNYVRRERKDRSDRFARHAYAFLDRVP